MFLKKLNKLISITAMIFLFSFPGMLRAEEICRVDLVDHWLKTIKIFEGNCADVRWDCRQEMRNRKD